MPLLLAILSVFLSVFLFAAGCGSGEEDPMRTYPLQSFYRTAQFPPTEPGLPLPPVCAHPPSPPAAGSRAMSLVTEHCLFGLPRRADAWRHGCTQYVFRDGYVLEYGDDDRIPLWVAERLGRERQKSFLGLGFLRRAGKSFAADPELRPGTSANPQDYDHAAYDPGHHAASANFAADNQRMKESFFLSNNAPQAKALNRGPWVALERRLREWVKGEGGAVHLLTGGFFWRDPQRPDGGRAGQISFFKLGTNPGPTPVAPDGTPLARSPVSVPTHFFKVVAWRPEAQGPWRATALVFENTAPERGVRGFASDEPSEHVVDLKWLEERTGLQFFPDASATDRAELAAGGTPGWLED